jgi:hypothetical protein
MTDPIIELLRELRPSDAHDIDAIFPAEEKAARLAAMLVTAKASALTHGSEAASLEAPTQRERAKRRRRPAYRRIRRPWITSALLAGGIVAVLLLFAGVLSGQGPTIAVPAQAAVLRGALDALDAHPGTILVESYDTLWPAMGNQPPFEQHQEVIYETPAGSGAQNFLTSYGHNTTETVTMNGVTEDYDPSNNTIYTAVDINPCGCNITPGSTPGTDIVTLLKIRDARPGTAAWEQNEHPPQPLTITAAQAQALRDGSTMLNTTGVDPGGAATRLQIVAAFRVPSETSSIQTQLREHKLKLDGTATIDGRDAIVLATADGSARYYVEPRTYDPIRTVIHNPGGGLLTTTFSQYQVLPDTPANQRLLSLIARHPGARIDNSHADYAAAETQLSHDSWPRATHPVRNSS